MGASHEDLSIFMTMSCWILLRMRNISDKSCRENQNTHFMYNNFFFQQSCHVSDNMKQYDRDGSIIWHQKEAICMQDN